MDWMRDAREKARFAWPSLSADRAVARLVQTLCVAAFVTLASGCATSTLTPADRAYTGRFSATTFSGDKRDNASGRFSLEVRGAKTLLELSSPLGNTLARIEVEPGGARATAAHMHEVRDTDVDALTQQLLGWPLPVSGLADWLEGQPAPQRTARVERESGRVALIEQDGWTIRIPEYSESPTRPRRLMLERPSTANAPSVSLRLVVDDPAA
ncbi:MAG: outer membrane lipoprotein LolB [Burkholderiaceae bacterium]